MSRFDEDASLRGASLLVTQTTAAAQPLFEAVDRQLQTTTGRNGIDAWDIDFEISRVAPFRLSELLPAERAMNYALSFLGHSDLYEKLTIITSGSGVISRCVPVDPPREVVVILPESNVDPHHVVLLHEVGHGVHAAGISDGLLYGDQEVLHRFETALLAWRVNSLRKHLRVLAIHLLLYRDEPVQDNAIQNEIAVIQRRFFPHVQHTHPFWWANDMYVVEYAFYGINYIYSWMIAAQIRAWWKRTHEESILSEGFGDFLRKRCYAPGNSVPWRELLKDATGEDFNLQYFFDELEEMKRRYHDLFLQQKAPAS